MLRIDLKPGEVLRIGDAVIRLEKKSGQIVSLSIEADRSIPITRVKSLSPLTAVDSAKNGISIN